MAVAARERTAKLTAALSAVDPDTADSPAETEPCAIIQNPPRHRNRFLMRLKLIEAPMEIHAVFVGVFVWLTAVKESNALSTL